MTRFCAAVTVDSWARAAVRAAAAVPRERACASAVCVEPVVSLSRKAYLPWLGTPTRLRGLACCFAEAPASEWLDVATPAARLPFGVFGAAPAGPPAVV